MKTVWKILLAVLLVIIILILLNKYSNEGFRSSNKTGYVMSGEGIAGTIPVENIITITFPVRNKDDPPHTLTAYLAQNDNTIINHIETTNPDTGKEETQDITVTGNMLDTVVKLDMMTQKTSPIKYTVTKQGSASRVKKPSKNPTGYTLSGGDITSPIPVLRIIEIQGHSKIYLAQNGSKIVAHSVVLKPLEQGYVTGNMIGNINTIDFREFKQFKPPFPYTLEKV